MKKMTNLIDKLAGYQIDTSETKNIKGGLFDLYGTNGIVLDPGEIPPF